MSTSNPYAAPKAAVADETVIDNFEFVPGGQPRPAGSGWTWITDSWELFKRQPGMWIGIVLLLFVIMIGSALVPLVGNFLITLFGPVFAAGICIGCKALDRGQELELAHLFAGFRERTGTLIGVGALYLAATLVIMLLVGLAMGVGFGAMMGQGDPEEVMQLGLTIVLAMLVMMALLLPFVMAVWFAAPLVVFHQHGAIEAMKASFAGCLRNMVPFLIYGVVLFLFSIAATIPLLLGWLVLGPMLAASIYTGYRDIYLKPR
jgi:hypothetical protein